MEMKALMVRWSGWTRSSDVVYHVYHKGFNRQRKLERGKICPDGLHVRKA